MTTATTAPHTISRADLPAAFGSPFAGGFYGGLVKVNGVLRAQAWAPKAEGQRKGFLLPRSPGSIIAPHCSDSLTNTRALAAAGSTLADQVLALRISGFDDWAIPARDVVELAYRHLKPTAHDTCASFRDGDNPSSEPPGYPYTEGDPRQTEVAAFRDGGPEAFEPGWHLTSTQYSANDAWLQYFGNGFQVYGNLGVEAWCRPVRSIQVL